MRPLLKKNITDFLDRFDNFIGAELRSIKIISLKFNSKEIQSKSLALS
jgi:hypothetical protein